MPTYLLGNWVWYGSSKKDDVIVYEYNPLIYYDACKVAAVVM